MAEKPTRVLIVGAGGHGQVVADILWRCYEQDRRCWPVGYLDDDPSLHGRFLLELPVLGPIAQVDRIAHDALVVAIGDNRIRRSLYESLAQRGERFARAVHPRAAVAPDAQVGPGTVIAAGAVVNPGCAVGANVILNTGATVDHHCHIEAHAHVAPGAHLGGGVSVGCGALVGMGAILLPGRRVGPWAVVGAGAVVVTDVPAATTVVGIPARPQALQAPSTPAGRGPGFDTPAGRCEAEGGHR
ncbi:MAG: transferase [Litorilinea sp.]|nr:MAG: transferase [Litorilinea sp.]